MLANWVKTCVAVHIYCGALKGKFDDRRSPPSVRVIHAYLSQLPSQEGGTIKVSAENINANVAKMPTKMRRLTSFWELFVMRHAAYVLSWRSSTRGSNPEMHPFKVRYRPLSFSMATNLEEPTNTETSRLENLLLSGRGTGNSKSRTLLYNIQSGK